jgi:hypothetical protein
VEGALVDAHQRQLAAGEEAVVGLRAAAEVRVVAVGDEPVEALDARDQRVGRYADQRGQLGQGVGGVPQARGDVLLLVDHRDVGGAHRRDRALLVVVDHPVGTGEALVVGQVVDDRPAQPVVGGRLVDEPPALVVDEDAAGEPQRERRPAVGVGEPGGPPGLAHQVGVRADGDRRLVGGADVGRRAHRVARDARDAVLLAQLVVGLEAARGQDHAAAGPDRPADAVVLDDRATTAPSSTTSSVSAVPRRRVASG